MSYGLVLRILVVTVIVLFGFMYFLVAPYWPMPAVPKARGIYKTEKSSRATNGNDQWIEQSQVEGNYKGQQEDGKGIPPQEESEQRPPASPQDIPPIDSTYQGTETVPSGIHTVESNQRETIEEVSTSPFISAAAFTTSYQPSSPSNLATSLVVQQVNHGVVIGDDPHFRTEYAKLTCRFPILDPWDDSILPFLSHPAPLNCPRVQQELTSVDSEGVLRFNETEYAKAISMYGGISCFYRQFDKLDDNDHSVVYVNGGEYFRPPMTIRLTHETVEVKCSISDHQKQDKPSSDKEIYWQLHAYPILSNSSTIVNNDPSLSVLILITDSISISAFQRHLPSTYAYLRDVMRFHTFRGHHKIGDNSFPNQMAWLLGKRVLDEHWPDMMDEVREDYRQIQFDHWPLVWRLFAERGYETSFNEDTPNWGLFHYFLRGFAKKPVHHYYHQFWLALKRGEGKYQNYCFGNRAKLEIQLDLVKTHLKNGRNRKWFDYVSATELFHQEEVYEAEKADPYLFRFFKEMYEGGYFNRTAIIFMSDHGHRYASLRQTLVGLVEERMPMLNVWFPDWFYHGNDFNSTLRNNTIRLTSQFDIHETLLDILHNNYRGSQRAVGTRGHSLLYPIPHDRTCAQAGIPDHFCTCLREEAVPTDDPTAADAVQAAVEHVNSILANFSQCSRLTVSKILRVELLGVNEEIARGVSDFSSAREFEQDAAAPTVRRMNKLRLTFYTQPGNALFEAITAKNPWKNEWVVNGRVQRLNAYGPTSFCVNNMFLFNYCICN